MNHLEPLHTQLEPKEIALESIYLDPNNPRFVKMDSAYIADDRIADEAIQKEALDTLEKHFGVDRIRMNMSVNGYLPIDRIVVREFQDGKYVVLEGNRRMAAARTLPDFTDDGSPVDDRVKDSIKIIPALVYSGTDSKASWLFQGIRHISGINDWSAYNKAKLLVEQMEKEGLALKTAGQRFGLTSHGAGQWVRSYYGFKQAREQTDYAAEIDERLYPYIQELFGRSSIHMKEWLAWDDAKKEFSKPDLLNEFVSWFYPRPNEDDTAGDFSGRGDWEKKRLSSRDDIRQLSYLVQRAPKFFELFRSGTDFEEAYSQAMVEEYERRRENDLDAADTVLRALDSCTTALKNIPLSMIKDSELNATLRDKLGFLEAAIAFVRE